MSNLLQLINEVLRRTGQTEVPTLVNASVPASQARDFCNETYFEMLQRLKVNRLLKQGTFNTVSGTASYALASDAEINSLVGDAVLETGTPALLREVDYRYPLKHAGTPQGKPRCFYRIGDLLSLFPVPDAVYAIQYAYFIQPKRLNNDADTPQLPADWETTLVLGVQARLENFLGEDGENSYLLYRDRLDQLKSRALPKPFFRMQGYYRGHA